VLSLWVTSAIWHSLVCFYVPALALSAKSAVSSAGQITDIWATGTLAYTVVIVVVCSYSIYGPSSPFTAQLKYEDHPRKLA
jgi:Phospholipid-translocating P-type ATPase C-terminal